VQRRVEGRVIGSSQLGSISRRDVVGSFIATALMLFVCPVMSSGDLGAKTQVVRCTNPVEVRVLDSRVEHVAPILSRQTCANGGSGSPTDDEPSEAIEAFPQLAFRTSIDGSLDIDLVRLVDGSSHKYRARGVRSSTEMVRMSSLDDNNAPPLFVLSSPMLGGDWIGLKATNVSARGLALDLQESAGIRVEGFDQICEERFTMNAEIIAIRTAFLLVGDLCDLVSQRRGANVYRLGASRDSGKLGRLQRQLLDGDKSAGPEERRILATRLLELALPDDETDMELLLQDVFEVLIQADTDLAQFDRAEVDALEYLRRCQRVENGTNSDFCVPAMNTLSRILRLRGKTLDAVMVDERVVPILEINQGPNDLTLALVWNRLGRDYLALGRVKDARGALERGIQALDRGFWRVGSESKLASVQASMLATLGEMDRDEALDDMAVKHFERAVEIASRGTDDPDASLFGMVIQLALSREGLHELEAAKSGLQEFLARHPKSAADMEEYEPTTNHVLLTLFRIQVQQADFPGALATWKRLPQWQGSVNDKIVPTRSQAKRILRILNRLADPAIGGPDDLSPFAPAMDDGTASGGSAKQRNEEPWDYGSYDPMVLVYLPAGRELAWRERNRKPFDRSTAMLSLALAEYQIESGHPDLAAEDLKRVFVFHRENDGSKNARTRYLGRRLIAVYQGRHDSSSAEQVRGQLQ
jgi:tetratricopeptide (TPR) repeat protein